MEKQQKPGMPLPRNEQQSRMHPTTGEVRQEKADRSLRRSIEEGVLNNSSMSIFSTFLEPLALYFNASNFQIGMLETCQDIGTTAGQVPGARLTEHMSRKGIWIISQLMGKVILLVPIAFLPFMNIGDPITVLIVLASLIAFFLALRAPAWTSLMGDLVSRERRGSYFGKRNMIVGIAGVIATVVGGFAVSSYGFPVIFVACIVLSILSIPFFLKMWEPSTGKVFHYRHSIEINPRNWLTAIRVNMGLTVFTSYMLFFNFAMLIASPFYVVYMLKNLSMSYEVFALLTIVGALVRIFSFKYWGYFNDRFGSRNILIVTGFFGCFVPLGWMLSTNSWEVLIVKIFDGFIFAGFDQVTFNYLLDITPAGKRPQYVANFNFFVGIGVILGAITGGILAQSLAGSAFFFLVGLQVVFLISFVIRLASLLILPKIRHADIKQTDIMPAHYVMWQTMAVEPANGLKSAIQFTFRYPFDREAEYKKTIRKLGSEQKRRDIIGSG